MSDQSVRAALRSTSSLVVIEAPAGCGKTHQGAEYAEELVGGMVKERLLVLTHTHSACSVFSHRTTGYNRKRMDVRTIDSFIGGIASAYHLGLGLPSDTATWVRQQGDDGHAQLAVRVSALLRSRPIIAASLAARHPFVICDEHQDSSGDQHAVVMAMLTQGARLRLFADPMQKIFKDTLLPGSSPAFNWAAITQQADAFEQLDTPHRWTDGCMQLGQWTLKAREILRAGGSIDLRSGLPPSIVVHIRENESPKYFGYQLTGDARREIDGYVKSQSSLLVLSRYNDTTRALRAHFDRRIALWEGHTRTALEKLVDSMRANTGNASAIAKALAAFLETVCKGFSSSAFGDRFQQEVTQGCTRQSHGRPASIQILARYLVIEPDHRGVEKVLSKLAEFIKTNGHFSDIKIDCHQEFWDAVHLGRFETVDLGLTEITHHRTFSRPKPHEKSISTIHKAKGLECERVLLLPCDAKTFPNKPDARCLLYVALTRAKSRLVLVVSRSNPSPLFII
jgi:hypothetical protein